MYVCVGGVGEEGERECVGGCDCVDVGVIVWVGVAVIAWVKKGVGGCDGLHCYRKVCVRRGERGRVCMCVCVCVTVWVWV